MEVEIGQVHAFNPEFVATLSASAKAKRVPFAVSVFIAFVFCFILTTLRSPIPKFMVLTYRWPMLFGAFGFFFLVRRYRVKGAPLTVPLFLLICSISTANADAWMISGAKLVATVCSIGIMFYFLPAALKVREYERLFFRLAAALVVISALSFFYGIGTGKLGGFGRYQSLYRGPNCEGTYIAFAFLSALWLYAAYPNSKYRYFLQFTFAANMVAIYATGSRSSFVGVVGGAMFWAATQLLRSPSKRKKQMITAFFVIGFVIILERSLFVKGWSMMTRDATTAKEFLASRLHIWQDSLEAFHKRPMLGFGYGVAEIADEDRGVGITGTGTIRDGAGYMGMLESVGILGCASFALIIFQIGMRVRLVFQKKITSNEALLSYVAFAQVVFLLINLIGEPWILGPGNPTFHLFWFYLATASYFSHTAYLDWKSQKRKQMTDMFKMLAASGTAGAPQRPLVG
ncbi:O-antigen ligase family protein [Candidatus Sumerlaeota bacterium]|nr:O-antigen ligase family protein [Candidatus Sumerlaeota bacterium]